MEKLMTPRPRITIPSHVPRPVRYDWLMAAATLSGKSLHLALALSWLAGLAHSPKVKLTRATMRRFSLSRDACARWRRQDWFRSGAYPAEARWSFCSAPTRNR